MKVAFLDRDGVINVDDGYVFQPEKFIFTDKCAEGLDLLQAQNYQLMIVTNQSGIGRAYYSEQAYRELTEWYVGLLAKKNIIITDVFYCPHTPEDHCNCRKPQPGLFLQAQQRYPEIDFSKSIMIGDKLSDLAAADAVGIQKQYLICNADVSAEVGELPVYRSLYDCALSLGSV